MIWLGALLAAGLGAIAGYALALAAAVGLMELSGTGYGPDGGGAMAAGFVFGPAGGLVGMVVGAFLVLRRGRRPAGAALLKALAVMAALVAGGYGALLLVPLYRAHFCASLALTGTPPRLLLDIRLDPASAVPARGQDVRLDLSTGGSQRPGRVFEILPPDAEGRVRLAADAELFERSADRLLVLRLPGEPVRLFRLRLPAGAPQMDVMSPWQRVDFTDAMTPDSRPRPAPPEDRTAIRYRVSWPGRD